MGGGGGGRWWWWRGERQTLCLLPLGFPLGWLCVLAPYISSLQRFLFSFSLFSSHSISFILIGKNCCQEAELLMARNLKSSNISVDAKISAGFNLVQSILFKLKPKEPNQSTEK